MADKHAHAALLDRLGKSKIHTLYNIKDRTWRDWRVKGIPGLYHNGIRTLAAIHGESSKELDQ